MTIGRRFSGSRSELNRANEENIGAGSENVSESVIIYTEAWVIEISTSRELQLVLFPNETLMSF